MTFSPGRVKLDVYGEPQRDKAPLHIAYDTTPGVDPYSPPAPQGYNPGQKSDTKYHGYSNYEFERPRVPYTKPDDMTKLSRAPPPLPLIPPPGHPNYRTNQDEELSNACAKHGKNKHAPAPPIPPIPPEGNIYSARYDPNFPKYEHNSLAVNAPKNLTPRGKDPIPPLPPHKLKDAVRRVPAAPLAPPAQPKDSDLFYYDPLKEELDKVHRQMQEADEDIRRYKEEKRKKQLEHQLEKVHDYNQLRNYDPWDKPGKMSNKEIGWRKQKFDMPSDAFRSDEGLTFNTQGGGAPLVSSSGEVITDVRGDPSIRFQDKKVGRQYIEPFRYHAPGINQNKYGQELAEEIKLREERRKQHRDFERKAEQETLNYNPFVREGKGAYYQEAEDAYSDKNPYWKEPFRGPMKNLYFPFGSPGNGAPRRDKDGNIMTQMAGIDLIGANRDITEMQQMNLRKGIYHDELEDEMLEHRLNEMRTLQQIKAPTGDVSEMIRQGKVGKPKRDPYTGLLVSQPRRTTDVTDISKVSPRDPDCMKGDKVPMLTTNQYANELMQAAHERSRVRELERLRERHEAHQHQRTFEKMWGRKGGGAPNSENDHRFADIEEALYYPELDINGNKVDREDFYFKKNLFLKPVEHRLQNEKGQFDSVSYVRSDTNATAENQFEIVDETIFQDNKRRAYNIRAPYAVDQEYTSKQMVSA